MILLNSTGDIGLLDRFLMIYRYGVSRKCAAFWHIFLQLLKQQSYFSLSNDAFVKFLSVPKVMEIMNLKSILSLLFLEHH